VEKQEASSKITMTIHPTVTATALYHKYPYLSITVGCVLFMLLFSIGLWGIEGSVFALSFSLFLATGVLFTKLFQVIWSLVRWKRYLNMSNFSQINFICTHTFVLLFIIFCSIILPLYIGDGGWLAIYALIDFAPLTLIFVALVFLSSKIIPKKISDFLIFTFLIIGIVFLLFWIYLFFATWFTGLPPWKIGVGPWA
jgi:hypothetical protein